MEKRTVARLAKPGTLLSYAREQLLYAVRKSKARVWISSPFITLPIAKQLAAAASLSVADDKRVLTALLKSSVRQGSLSPTGLDLLAGAGFTLATARNLHAKLSIIDGDWGLVGSGNLTHAGLGRRTTDKGVRGNVELGVVLADQQVAEAGDLFERWWDAAAVIDTTLITRYEALERSQSDRERGGDGGPIIPVPTGDSIAELLLEDETGADARNYFLKAAYFRQGQDQDGWWLRGWISDWRGPPYRVNDLIVLYLGGPGSPKCCPAILRVESPAEHAPAWVERHGAGKIERKYPYVTKTSCIFDIPTEQAPNPRAFGIDPRSTQPGYRGLSRPQFEAALLAMASG